MRDFAERFAAADPARTPANAPLPEEALALLDRVMTPRIQSPAGSGRLRTRSRRPRWGRVAVGIVAPVLVLTALVMARGCSSALGPWPLGAATATASAVPSPVSGEFTSEDDLVAAADAIVVAETVSVSSAAQDGQSYWLATVRVQSAARGEFKPGDSLQVAFVDQSAQLGHFWPAGLDPNQRALLFLTTPGVAGADAQLVSPTQGSYLIQDGAMPSASDANPLTLDPDFLARMGLTVA